MADEKSHLSWAFLLGVVFFCVAIFVSRVNIELSLLAAFMVMIGSIIPNIDSTDDGLTGEISGLIGALLPVLLLNFFPELLNGSTIRIALTIIVGYFFARIILSYFGENFFSPRGALHSIPAIILFFEVGYILFPDLTWEHRALLGTSLASGVASHIFLDAFTNLTLVKKTLAKNAHSGQVLKFSGATVSSTWFLYLTIVFLGWFVAKDLDPSLKVQAPVTSKQHQ